MKLYHVGGERRVTGKGLQRRGGEVSGEGIKLKVWVLIRNTRLILLRTV